LVHHTVARQPLLRWLGAFAAATSLQFPKSGSVAHIKENAVALSLTLTPQELQTLDAAHPPPGFLSRLLHLLR
jgi:diketogulonate reductase-like aldo/keto reductase